MRALYSKNMHNNKGHCVIITNDEGKYLMQFRDGTPGIHSPLMWEFFGGSSEWDESVTEAAVRELKEELDIVVQPADLEIIAQHKMGGKEEYLLRYKQPLHWKSFVVLEGAGCAFLTKEESCS